MRVLRYLGEQETSRFLCSCTHRSHASPIKLYEGYAIASMKREGE